MEETGEDECPVKDSGLSFPVFHTNKDLYIILFRRELACWGGGERRGKVPKEAANGMHSPVT